MPPFRATAIDNIAIRHACGSLCVVTPLPPREFKFRVGKYRAEIRESKSGKRQWYVMVHREDSGDLAAIERFESYDEAREAVLTTLSRMNHS